MFIFITPPTISWSCICLTKTKISQLNQMHLLRTHLFPNTVHTIRHNFCSTDFSALSQKIYQLLHSLHNVFETSFVGTIQYSYVFLAYKNCIDPSLNLRILKHNSMFSRVPKAVHRQLMNLQVLISGGRHAVLVQENHCTVQIASCGHQLMSNLMCKNVKSQTSSCLATKIVIQRSDQTNFKN